MSATPLLAWPGVSMKLLLATRNAHKAHEIRAVLAGSGIAIETLLDHPELAEPPEPHDTFEDNALAKAAFVHDLTGRAVLADDSGLEVDALGGLPGVRSRRFSPQATDTANNTLLLERLQGHTDRRARFRCVVALVTTGFRGTVSGACDGGIATDARGSQGFGYDPLFIPDELDGRTMAEATMVEKNAISHRGRAFRQLPTLLAQAGLLRGRGRQG